MSKEKGKPHAVLNFNGVIIICRLYFITAEFHSGSETNLISVSAMKLLEVSRIEAFLPILFFLNNQFGFIFLHPCQAPCPLIEAHLCVVVSSRCR